MTLLSYRLLSPLGPARCLEIPKALISEHVSLLASVPVTHESDSTANVQSAAAAADGPGAYNRPTLLTFPSKKYECAGLSGRNDGYTSIYKQ